MLTNEQIYTETLKQFNWINKTDIMSKSEFEMAFSCDAPNKPGYYRANND